MNSVFIDSNAILHYFAGDSRAREALNPIIEGISLS